MEVILKCDKCGQERNLGHYYKDGDDIKMGLEPNMFESFEPQSVKMSIAKEFTHQCRCGNKFTYKQIDEYVSG